MCSAEKKANISAKYTHEGGDEIYELEFHRSFKLTREQYNAARKFLTGAKYDKLKEWLEKNFPDEAQEVSSIIGTAVSNKKID
jgi:hypothetical protein